MIRRRNILDLIGKHRKKYHSCVMTCYSMDFSFFEERVLRSLRLANIKNVNILADGHYLEMAQEVTSGKEFKHNKTYNVQPIYERGVFHPKIMLLTGVKHGLLVIGSGNITSSGLSTNDEIWGAFHLDNVGNENAPLFGAVWNYLQPYLNTSLGFVSQKMEWIRKYSPWLAELPVADDWVALEGLNAQVKFLANSEQVSMFNQLTSVVPDQKVEELTVVSPYYDKNGQQLKQFRAHFQPGNMRCLVDPNSGLLPYELDRDIASHVHFYNWADCKQDFVEDSDKHHIHKLHAKMLHVKSATEEYLLLGSANATVAAMGGKDIAAANAEAGILLKRPLQDRSWLQELDIHIPDETIELSHSPGQDFQHEPVPRNRYRYKILYAELRENEVTIYLNRECQEKVRVVVLDRMDQSVACVCKEEKGNRLVARVADADDTFKLSLYDAEERISNYCLIHRLNALLRCNPDPTMEKLDAFLEEDYPDGDGVTSLLQFVDYTWADEGSEKAKQPSRHQALAIGSVGSSRMEQHREYEQLEAEAFNTVSSESLLKQNGELANSSVKIAEFLGHISSGMVHEDFTESEEQRLLEDQDQQGEGKEINNKTIRRVKGSQEKAAMLKYFRKLDDLYSKELRKFFNTRALTEVPNVPVTIKSLSTILIALHLIQLKDGKKFPVSTTTLKEDDAFVIREELYLKTGVQGDSVDSIKGFLLNVLGKFLLLSGAGGKEYEYDILNQKLASSQQQMLIKSLWLILNTPWHNSEKEQRDLLVLNALHFSVGKQLLEEGVVPGLFASLEKQRQRAGYVRTQFQEQLDDFKANLLPDYLAWLRKFTDIEMGRKELICLTEDLRNDSIIFNSSLGFNIVQKVIRDNTGSRLHLSRPGYPFEKKEFSLEDIQFGTKSILYR